MTENKSPEYEDEFIECFALTKFKSQRIWAEVTADFKKGWSTEDYFFLAGSFEIVSFEAGSFKFFTFWLDRSWWGDNAIWNKERVLSLCRLPSIWDFKAEFPMFPTLIYREQYWQNTVSESFLLTCLLYWSFFSFLAINLGSSKLSSAYFDYLFDVTKEKYRIWNFYWEALSETNLLKI